MTQAQLPEAASSVNERELGRLARSLAGKTVTASYTLDPGDNIVRFDTSVGNLVATLPAAALMQERFVTIKKVTVDANTVTVTPASGETIDGSATSVLSVQWQSYTFFSDGTRWSIIWVYDTLIPANLAAEAATRAAADSAEASTRASADSSEATARANADSLLQPTSAKNQPSGYAGLDGSSKLAGAQQTYGSAANTACVGNDSRLSDSRIPTAHAATHQPGGTDAMAVDAAAATGSLRTIGTGGQQACAGSDSRLSDKRLPLCTPASLAGVVSGVPTTALALGAITVNGERWEVSIGGSSFAGGIMVIVVAVGAAWTILISGATGGVTASISGNNLQVTQATGSNQSFDVRGTHYV